MQAWSHIIMHVYNMVEPISNAPVPLGIKALILATSVHAKCMLNKNTEGAKKARPIRSSSYLTTDVYVHSYTCD